MTSQVTEAPDNVTAFVGGLGTSATLSMLGVDPEKELEDVVELLERVFVEVYASGFSRLTTDIMKYIEQERLRAEEAGKAFDWLPTVEDWALMELDDS